MFRRLIHTSNDPVATLLRLALGIVILPHGLQKAFGWFGGGGVGGTLQFFDQSWGIPAGVALLVIGAELLGSLGLIAGLLSRVAASGIALVMLGAIYLVHRQVGFFMNWGGTQPGEGFEYHVLAVAIALAVAIKGSGAWSLDRALWRQVTADVAVREAHAPPVRKAA